MGATTSAEFNKSISSLIRNCGSTESFGFGTLLTESQKFADELNKNKEPAPDQKQIDATSVLQQYRDEASGLSLLHFVCHGEDRKSVV